MAARCAALEPTRVLNMKYQKLCRFPLLALDYIFVLQVLVFTKINYVVGATITTLKKDIRREKMIAMVIVLTQNLLHISCMDNPQATLF